MLQDTTTPQGAVDTMGFPILSPTAPSPVATATDPLGGQSSSWLDSIESGVGGAWNGIKNAATDFWSATDISVADVENSASKAYQGVKSEVASAVTFGTTQIILLVAVAGIALYFVGKSGIVGQARP